MIDTRHSGAFHPHRIHQRDENRYPGKKEYRAEQLERGQVAPIAPMFEQQIHAGDGHHHHRHFHNPSDGKHDQAGPDQE